jgi:hypothetical protein
MGSEVFVSAVPTRKLKLKDLARGIDAINSVMGALLAQACAVCLDNQNHVSGVLLTVTGSFSEDFELYWEATSDLIKLGWKDEKETVSMGACGLAVLLIRELTTYAVIERACIGTGIDYWLGHKNELPFQKKARLEVSGISKGSESRIQTRVKEKIDQTKPSDGELSAYIVVVEFSRPVAQVVKK